MYRLIAATLLALAVAAVSFWLAWDAGRDPLLDADRAADRAEFVATLAGAETGDRQAEARLGDHYRQGLGVAADPVKAVHWYGLAAGKGHVGAQYMMGRMLETGEGVAKNPFRAAEWYELAANLGKHADARYRLGDLYFRGLGVPHDYARAVELYRSAAEQGHPAAQFKLGAMLEDGWGMRQDLSEAYMWYKLAARRAGEVLALDPKFDPVKALENLKAKMNLFQINQGEKLLREWKPAS